MREKERRLLSIIALKRRTKFLGSVSYFPYWDKQPCEQPLERVGERERERARARAREREREREREGEKEKEKERVEKHN